MRQRVAGIGNLVDVEEHRTRYALLVKLGPAVAACIRQIVGRIHDHDVRRVQTLREPCGRYKVFGLIHHGRHIGCFLVCG